ncbi:MAG: PEP-CTERM sorting domain-containing protein [Synechocystis sp.]
MSMLKKYLRPAISLGATCALTAIGTGNAEAAIFTDKTTFLNVTTGLTTVDFEGLIAPDTAGALPSTVSGVTFSNTGGSPFLLNCATLPSSFGNCPNVIEAAGPTTVGGTGNFPNVITAQFPGGFTAVGIDFLPYSFGDTQTVSTSTGETYEFTFNNNPPAYVQFVGFTSDVPITSLTFTVSTASGQLFDNVVYGQATSTEVPEPLTILGASAAVAFGAGFKHRKSVNH